MARTPRTSATDREHQEDLLDEALAETFPASDPVSMVQPAPGSPAESSPAEGGMPTWLVQAIWYEDEGEAAEQWQVTAATADEAVAQARPRFRLPPHHVEVRRLSPK
jgi:hypothetical protein